MTTPLRRASSTISANGFVTGLLLLLLVACIPPTQPPHGRADARQAFVDDAGAPAALAAAAHPVSTLLHAGSGSLFLRRASACPRLDIAHTSTGEVTLSTTSPAFCSNARITISVVVDGERVEVQKWRTGFVTTNGAGRSAPRTCAGGRSSTMRIVDEHQLAIGDARVFADRAACLSAPDDASAVRSSSEDRSCLDVALGDAFSPDIGPAVPSGAFVVSFERLIQSGGTVWDPNRGCNPVAVTRAEQATPTHPELDFAMVASFRDEQGRPARSIDNFSYSPACKRLTWLGTSHHQGAGASGMGEVADWGVLSEPAAPGQLPSNLGAFYTKAACLQSLKRQVEP